MHSIRAAAALALVLLATHPRGWAARGAITAAVVLPHGDIAWWPQGADPPLNASQRQQAEALRSAAEAAGQLLAEQRPDLILLTTPHGLATSRHTALLLNPTAAGCLDPAAAWRAAQAGLCGSAGVDAAAPGAPCPCSNVTLDAALSLELLQRLEDRGIRRTTGLSGFGPPGQAEAPLTIGWGEVIPMQFLPDKLRQAARFVLLSFPSRRYNESTQMVPELLKLGGALLDSLDALPQRVAVVVSADLAHTHSPDGPYGYSEDAQLFDDAVAAWLETLDPDRLLQEAKQRQAGGAKSCGFTGLVLLQGMLQRAAELQSGGSSSSGSDGGSSLSAVWESRLLARAHPTYFGMAVGTIQRRGDSSRARS